MPPKRRNPPNSSSKKLTKEPCCVCCQLITIGKDEALFCSGNCQQWMHRYCASVSVKCYSDITAKDTPFFCFCCQEGKNTLEIATLKETVESLKQEIAALKESLSEAQSEARALSGQQRDSQRSYAAATCSGELSTSSIFTHVSNPLTIPSNRDAAAARPNNHLDRKYNVIVYGVNECPKGTTKHARLESDLNGAVTVLSKLDNHVQNQSLKDVYRLGKFNPVAIHPRPLLVKFIRATDVVSVLSKKGSLSYPLFIKPDLSPQEKQRDSILLKERWSLVQTGILRHDIKTRGPRLYVKGKLFCHFSESQVIYSSGPSELLPIPASLPQSALSAKDNTSMPPNENESLSPVPVNSIAVSKSPVETSSTDKNTSCATSVVQCNVSHTLAQSQSPRHSPLPVSDNGATPSD